MKKSNGITMRLVLVVVATCGRLMADPAATLYVDGNVAVSGNGLSWATAYKTIQSAEIAGGHNTHRLFLIRGEQCYSVSTTAPFEITRGGLSPTERKIYRGVPGTNGLGRLPILSGASNLDETTFTAVGDPYPNVYQVARAGSVAAVWESPLDGILGTNWTLYVNKVSLTEVQNTPKSRWLSNNILYVHTSTGAHPTNFIVKYVVPSSRVDVYKSYMSFENLEFRHMWDTTMGLVGTPHLTHIGIYSNVFHSGSFGIGVRNCSDVDIAGNVFFNLPDAAVNVSSNYASASPHDMRIWGNTLRDGAGGIFLRADGNNWIYGNFLEGARISTEVYDGSDSSKFVRIFNNRIAHAPFYGIYALRTPGVRIYNNTVAECTSRGIYLNTGSTNAFLFNNLVTVYGANSRCLHVEDAAQAGLISSNNNFYATVNGNVGYWGGYRATLADWKTASGQDGNSLSVDPKFANAVAGDFRLMRDSSCRNVGRAAMGGVSAPDTDLDGILRSLNDRYDLGAYEYPTPRGTLLQIR